MLHLTLFFNYTWLYLQYRADSSFAPTNERQSNAVSHWLGANLESTLAIWKRNLSTETTSQSSLLHRIKTHWINPQTKLQYKHPFQCVNTGASNRDIRVIEIFFFDFSHFLKFLLGTICTQCWWPSLYFQSIPPELLLLLTDPINSTENNHSRT